VQYSQLSKKAHRLIKPAGLPMQLRLATKNHYICRGFAILGLLPLSASVLMAITLDGGEQTFYQFVVALLLPLVLVLGLIKHHLVLDNPSKQRFVQLQFMGYHFKKAYQAPLQSTELLLRHDSHDRSQYELKLHNIIYPIGSLADTTQVVFFFAKTFTIPAKEQVTDFPNIHDLEVSPLADSSVVSHYSGPNVIESPSEPNHANANSVGVGISKNADNIGGNTQPSVYIKPLWQAKMAIRFFYPLPFIMVFGFTMKFIGGL
jgi:hypothetical protein